MRQTEGAKGKKPEIKKNSDWAKMSQVPYEGEAKHQQKVSYFGITCCTTWVHQQVFSMVF